MASSAENCIWMAAGVIAYRLCDRGFDCEHCPLDMALQGRTDAPRLGAVLAQRNPNPITFPEDRSYSRSHFWVRNSTSPARVGLDAFGVHLLGSVNAVRGLDEDREIERGEALLELDLGVGNLTLHSPLRGLLHGVNPRLRERPGLVLSDCYREGWIAELTAESRGGRDEESLMDHTEIERCAHHDSKRFRRRIAHYLLADDLGVGPTLADGGVFESDLRLVLGYPRFLELLTELLG